MLPAGVGRAVHRLAALGVEYLQSLLEVEQVHPGFLLVELLDIELEKVTEDSGGVGFLVELGVVEVGDDEDDHGEAVESALVGDVELLLEEVLLEDDHHRVEGGDVGQPAVYGSSGDQSHVAALLVAARLHSDVCVQGTAGVGAVERGVGFEGGVQEGDGGIDGQLNDWDNCRLDDLDLGETGVHLHGLRHPLQPRPQPLPLRQVRHAVQQAVVNGDVDVAVLDRDAARAAPEESDRDAVVGQQELDALEGHHPSLEVLVGLLRNAVRHLLQLLLEPQQAGELDVGGGGGGGWGRALGGEFGAGTADGDGLLLEGLLFLTIPLQCCLHGILLKRLLVSLQLVCPFLFALRLLPPTVSPAVPPALLELGDVLLYLVFVFGLVGLVGLETAGLALPGAVPLLAGVLFDLLLGVVVAVGAEVLEFAFVAHLLDFALPVVVDEFVVGDHGGERLLQPALEDPVAEVVLLQLQQLPHLHLQLFD